MAETDVTRIAGNIGAMNALNSLATINKQLSIHQTRLATGKRINSAADDPAGLTIATKMDTRSQGLGVALDNIADAKNLLSVAESGVGKINDILVQMHDKALSGASDTMGDDERKAIAVQLKAYAAQIDDIVGQTKWNDKKLIDGSFDGSSTASTLVFQTGSDQGDTTSLTDGVSNLDSSASGLNITMSTALYNDAVSTNVTVGKASDFSGYLTSLESAMTKVNGEMSKIGAMTGRLTFKEDQVSASKLNIEAAYNRVMNANMADEQVQSSKYQILQQTSTAMLAQANAAPQFLLSLFK